MTVDLPNGFRSSKLELTDVQYSSQLTYIPMSVGNLNEKGFTVKSLKIIRTFTELSITLKHLILNQKNPP